MDVSDEGEKSSRVYVQGLPAYLDAKRLRELFEERGEVTDARIMRTADGRSRQFGFVGFRDENQAADAITYFNNSYIDTSKTTIKFAEKNSSANLTRPWSKHSKGSSAYQKRERQQSGSDKQESIQPAKKQKIQKAKPAAEEDPELEEFLQVMQPRRKTAIWADDSAMPASALSGSKQPTGESKASKRSRVEASKDSGVTADAAHKESKDEARRAQKRGQRLQAAADNQREEARRKKRSKRNKEAAKSPEGPVSGIDSEDAAANLDRGRELSDLEYLKQRTKAEAFERRERNDQQELRVSGTTSSDPSQSDDVAEEQRSGGDPSRPAEDQEEQENPGHEGGAPPVAQTGRLFLRNLTYSATKADLAALLGSYGELAEVHLVIDKNTQKSKGFALVQFAEAADADAALAALDGSIFQGRLLHILPGEPPRGAHMSTQEPREEAAAQANGAASSFAETRSVQQKENAGNRAAWNPLFMRSDTVAEAIAEHYGVSKAQLLHKEAADLPVRMALGEAHVIAMTKAGLAEAGVAVDTLEAAAASSSKAGKLPLSMERSDRVLLVKNLPYTATERELQEVFGQSGSIARLVLPKTKTIALVEFTDAGDARRAFKAVAYRKFQNVPLFLEWAPKGIFTTPPGARPSQQAPAEGQAEQDSDPSIPKASLTDIVALRESEGQDDVDSTSLYVKNLAWSTSEDALQRHFDSAVSAAGGSIRAVTVARKKAARGAQLSAGYGFVECSSEAVAKIVLRKLQGSLLDGHKLVLQLSIRKEPNKSAAGATKKKKKKLQTEDDAKQTKVVVRNVAFEASAKEVRALFQPFGQVKSVRLPRKFDHTHRGFAFVDFLSHQEALNAMEGVAGTHLYGRRLVCEWAATSEEGLDDLRAKTASKFQPTVDTYTEATETRKRKKHEE